MYLLFIFLPKLCQPPIHKDRQPTNKERQERKMNEKK